MSTIKGAAVWLVFLAAPVGAFLNRDSNDSRSAVRESIRLDAAHQLDDWVTATDPDRLVADLAQRFRLMPPDPEACTSLRADLAATRATAVRSRRRLHEPRPVPLRRDEQLDGGLRGGRCGHHRGPGQDR